MTQKTFHIQNVVIIADDLELLNHGIHKRLARVASKVDRDGPASSLNVDDGDYVEGESHKNASGATVGGKLDPKFLPVDLEKLSTAEVQDIFNSSVVYNDSKTLFTCTYTQQMIWYNTVFPFL